MLILPVVSFAASLVPCNNNSVVVTNNGTSINPTPCDFNAFMTLINTVIRFILFDLAIPIAAIMMAYAGFLLVKAQGGEAKTKAKSIFTNAVFGLIFAVAAWLIIRTILSILGYDGGWIGF